MKFNDNNRLDYTDPDGDSLTADIYENDTKPSTGFLVLVTSNKSDGFMAAVRMSRKQTRKFALALLKKAG